MPLVSRRENRERELNRLNGEEHDYSELTDEQIDGLISVALRKTIEREDNEGRPRRRMRRR